MAKKKKSRGHLTTAGVIVLILAVLIVIGGGIWLITEPGKAPADPPESSEPTVTTAATTAPTTEPTTEPTTVAPTTVPTTAATTAPKQNGGRELIPYDTAGRYVQASSYSDGESPAWNLILVNDWNPLPENYDSGVSFVPGGHRNQKVDSRMLDALNKMLEAGKAYGIDLQSGYRPSSQQATLYWRQVDRYLAKGYDNQKAQELAGTVVKRPGYSEHNSGLAADLGGSGNFKLETDFETTPAFKWLIEHCAEYGFILRFPKNKEAETGVIYEPWHYRYVGEEAARAIMDGGLCLEEYLEQIGK